MNFIKLFNLLTCRNEYINLVSIFSYYSKTLSNDAVKIEGTHIQCINGYEIDISESIEDFEMMLETAKQNASDETGSMLKKIIESCKD